MQTYSHCVKHTCTHTHTHTQSHTHMYRYIHTNTNILVPFCIQAVAMVPKSSSSILKEGGGVMTKTIAWSVARQDWALPRTGQRQTHFKACCRTFRQTIPTFMIGTSHLSTTVMELHLQAMCKIECMYYSNTSQKYIPI